MDRFRPGGRKLLVSANSLGAAYSRGLCSLLGFSRYGPRLSDAITSGISSVAPENNAAFADVLAASHKLVPTAWLSYAHVVAFVQV